MRLGFVSAVPLGLSGPHLADPTVCVDVPEANFGVPYRAVDCRHGVEEALGDLVEGGVAVREADEVAACQGAEFVGAVANAAVLSEQGPATTAAFGDPFGVADLLRILRVEIGEQVDDVSGGPQSMCRGLPEGCGRGRTQAAWRRTSSTTDSVRSYSSATALIGSPVRQSATTSSTLTLLAASTGEPQPKRGSMTTSALEGY